MVNKTDSLFITLPKVIEQQPNTEGTIINKHSSTGNRNCSNLESWGKRQFLNSEERILHILYLLVIDFNIIGS